MGNNWQTAVFNELSLAQLYDLLRLRQEVFVVEQDSVYLDVDGRDQQAVHILCWQESHLAAYLRCLPPGLAAAESALGRIVVSRGVRGQGQGRELVRRGIRHNLQQWPGSGIRINAQAYLLDYYIDLHFIADGDEYDHDGIPHIQMVYREP